MRVRIAEGHRVYHEGADRLAGEVIDVRESVGRVLKKMGKVVPAGEERPLRVSEPQPARGDLLGRSLTSESPNDGDKPRGRRSNRYDRRDMQAKDQD